MSKWTPSLGLTLHAVVAAVSLSGVTCATVLIELDSRNFPVPFYSYAIPAAVLVLTILTTLAWSRRRWPFDVEPGQRREWLRVIGAALGGGGIGAYAGTLTDWFFDVSLDMVWWVLLPISVLACAGDGYLRALVRAAALHVGAEIGAQMAYGSLFGVSWTVTRNHLPYIPAGLGGALACEMILRRLRSRFALRPRRAPVEAEHAPRRAR